MVCSGRARDLKRGSRGCRFAFKAGLSICLLIFALPTRSKAVLNPSDVLLVVNENSPTSVYVADLYRQYYPSIANDQVVYLSGLADCGGPSSTPANEIISRTDYVNKIATPVRNHLVNNNMVNSTKVIVTTAGLPYRIEDNTYGNIVYPSGSSPYSSTILDNVTAASVESELSVLFHTDPSSPNPMPLNNRVVNPYQGYRGSGIEQFDRAILTNRENMNWNYPRSFGSTVRPWMEGDSRKVYGMQGRNFSAGDIYLTCRLDGPKEQGSSAVFAVHDMLERSRRASSPDYGVNPALAVAVFDDAPGASNLDYSRLFNLDAGMDYYVYDSQTPQPPDTYLPESHDDYRQGYQQMTWQSAVNGILNQASMSSGYDLTVINDQRAGQRTSQTDLGVGSGIVALAGYGTNGDEGSASNYLTNGGPGGGALFEASYGAVFTSIESFNGVTMFSDTETGPISQGKLVDFITMGGSGAIGHAFEPYSDAAIDNEFLFYNLLADEDGDGYADMSFAEAAFTAIPYLSWSEVIIGDPLMRIAYGEGGIAHSERLLGDVNLDGYVTYYDLWLIGSTLGGYLGEDELYYDLMDINQDMYITYYDLWLTGSNLGTSIYDNMRKNKPQSQSGHERDRTDGFGDMDWVSQNPKKL